MATIDINFFPRPVATGANTTGRKLNLSSHRLKRKLKSPFIQNGIMGIFLMIISYSIVKVVFQKDMFSALIAIAAFIGLIVVAQGRELIKLIKCTELILTKIALEKKQMVMLFNSQS